jgi:hypothetical protein
MFAFSVNQLDGHVLPLRQRRQYPAGARLKDAVRPFTPLFRD